MVIIKNKFFIFLLLFFTGIIHANASVVVSPTVAGWSPSTNMFNPSAANSPTYNTSPSGVSTSGVVRVGGRSATIPVKFSFAANAGRFAKEAFRLNPYKIAGTLAAAWLIEQGVEYFEDDGWSQLTPLPAFSSNYSPYCEDMTDVGDSASGIDIWGNVVWAVREPSGPHGCSTTAPSNFLSIDYCNVGLEKQPDCGWEGVYRYSGNPLPKPMTADDWDVFPNPVPAIFPDYLPDSAPAYAPDGLPVNDPEFQPADVPFGDPYAKPDGSTVQPRVRITPNQDPRTVTVDSYEQPLTDPTGAPVAEGSPAAAPVDVEEKQDLCESNPDILACSKLDAPPDESLVTEQKTIADITPINVSGGGACPADIQMTYMGQALVMPWTPICNAASWLNPLVLALAWLSAGLIFIGGVKT